MTGRTLALLSILIVNLTFLSCHKDTEKENLDKKFCSAVNVQDFDATGPLIDEFLESISGKGQEEQLEDLRTWLEEKCCIDSAEIVCNSCIETLPPQSEIRLVFFVNGQPVIRVLDILMGEPMSFRDYHE